MAEPGEVRQSVELDVWGNLVQLVVMRDPVEPGVGWSGSPPPMSLSSIPSMWRRCIKQSSSVESPANASKSSGVPKSKRSGGASGASGSMGIALE